MKPSRYLVFFLLSLSFKSFALEKTAVLPKGIRNVTLKQVNVNIQEKYYSNGERRGLFDKPLTFQNLVDKKSGVDKLLLKGFLEGKFSLDESVGNLRANMVANLKVHVPIVSYGVTDKLTLAMAVPYYQAYVAYSDAEFSINDNAEKLLKHLNSEEANQSKSGKQAAEKLNNAMKTLEEKLPSNNYQKLGSWRGKGVGDVVLVAKYKFLDHKILKMANSSGLTLPTGRIKDPDILNDIPFGSGTASIFSSLISDQELSSFFLLNEYAKVTAYLPNEKMMRFKTEQEEIEVPKFLAQYQTGPKLEAGVSGQFNTEFGLTGGFGYVHEFKMKDSYEVGTELAVKEKLEKDTDYYSNHMIAKIGYSSLPAFKRKTSPIPAMASVEYRKQFLSKNTEVKDLLTVDFAVFF